MTHEEALEILKQTSPLRITVSGDIGSGKSTFAKRLSEELDVPRIYIGQLMREEAARRGITLDDLGKIQEKDDSLDRAMDRLQQEKSREIERGIFEGRTAWHFVEHPTVRVFLSVDPHIAAERIWGDSSNPLRDQYPSVHELQRRNEERKQSEIKRYQAYYGIDAYDPKNFDLIIDTSPLTIEDAFRTGVTAIAEHLQKQRS